MPPYGYVHAPICTRACPHMHTCMHPYGYVHAPIWLRACPHMATCMPPYGHVHRSAWMRAVLSARSACSAVGAAHGRRPGYRVQGTGASRRLASPTARWPSREPSAGCAACWVSSALRPVPCPLSPAPCTRCQAPLAIHHIPSTLYRAPHPAPCTLHPVPCTQVRPAPCRCGWSSGWPPVPATWPTFTTGSSIC